MASVREVYNALQDLANKDERGFISPENFNAFAPVAQTKVFNSIFDRLTGLERLRIRNVDSAGDKSLIKQAKEDLARFSKESTRTRTTGNHFSYPDDFAKVIAIRTYGDVLLGTSTTKPVSIIYDEEKFAHVLNSTLSAPTTDRPVAFVSNVTTSSRRALLRQESAQRPCPSSGLPPWRGKRYTAIPARLTLSFPTTTFPTWFGRWQ